MFSSLNALTLSPALSAVILRPFNHPAQGFLGKFENMLNYSKSRYVTLIERLIRKTGITVLILAGLISFNIFH